MATRKQVREGFYSHLETAVDGLVPADNIGQEEPEGDEEYPAVVHRDDYRPVPMNGSSSAPTRVRENESGEITAEGYEKYMEASFALTIRDHDEKRKERIYAAIRSYFEKFEERPWDPAVIQRDIEWVNVLDSSSTDDTSSNLNVRGDRLIVRLGFARVHWHESEPVRSASTSVGAGDTVED